ncbi:polyprenyl synthetase family protein [Algoriphagus machipongonensis]|uniref:Polyprenyl synthetase n=1 Tax=Algoriphagus machipongonensis TaxID=388413 RepID=A3HX57_9BACT|nr:polyprenyl synthetase family protein [Algoriphagus machipongonensis]EAZ81180.1 polyprenyl synthetase [Algoriphagus machipongonensis]
MTEKSHATALLDKLEVFIQNQNFGESPKELYEPINYILNIGGKRIRPLLSLLAYGMYAENPGKILSQASAIEVFHNFTLMHDDIMDQAPLRRGNATVHEKWDANIAILSGDVMLVKAYDLLMETEPALLPEIIRLFNKTAADVCEGQQFDMNFENQDHVNEKDYLNMIRLKTAVLLGCALKMGAILGGASSDEAHRLYEFGVNVGIGFQLKDDLLDVFADQEKFGKQVGGDIISNKKTFLLIKAKELASGEIAQELDQWIAATEFDKEEKVNSVKAIYEKLGIRELTEKKMNSYFDAGFEQLENINSKYPSYFNELKKMTVDLIHREK